MLNSYYLEDLEILNTFGSLKTVNLYNNPLPINLTAITLKGNKYINCYMGFLQFEGNYKGSFHKFIG